MKTKKWVVSLFAVLLLVSTLCVPVFAEEQEPEFYFELAVDGKDTVEVNTGDIITVTLFLHRTDKDAAYTMYAMQDEIRYDGTFFELVEDSLVLSNGIQSTHLDVGDGMHELYMNFLSWDYASWQPKTRIGIFQLRVIGTTGVQTITSEDFIVTRSDGSGSYTCKANKLTVIRTTECTVNFETNGGSAIDPADAIYGELLTRPADPVRDGMHFEGWYKDIHLTEKWNFDTDTVNGNITLYAKWTQEETETTPPPPVPPVEPEHHCPLCNTATDHALCVRCSLILYSVILTLIVPALLLGILLYVLITKNRKQAKAEKAAKAQQAQKPEDKKQE